MCPRDGAFSALVIWSGPKHSGKTQSVGELIEHVRARGITVAGVLAPSIYEGEVLVGFDAVDLVSGARAVLARRGIAGSEQMGSFTFTANGLSLGRSALSVSVVGSADLVVVDEFGRLELQGGGWREAVDRLVTLAEGVVLLVVREELVHQVQRVYAEYPIRALSASAPESIDQMIALLTRR